MPQDECVQVKNQPSQANIDRKVHRKQRRLQHMLTSEFGVEPVDSQEKKIAVCNAGLATGLEEIVLLQACLQFGEVERIIMLQGKSYCFVIFSDLESAVSAYESIHGKLNLAQGGRPLYLSYVKSVPLNEDAGDSEIPDGLKLLENFVTEEEERDLLSSIDWDSEVSIGSMKHRSVKHFGYEFLYGSNNIDLNTPLEQKIPLSFNFLWSRLNNLDKEKFDSPPNQLTVNQYNPGQGIPSHVDTHSAFLSPILSLSLGADVVMEFRCDDRRCAVTLPQRSLLIMDGSARYEWSHGIAPRSYDLVDGRTKPRGQRTSFTLRWVRPDATCHCAFPKRCDTFNAGQMTLNPELELLAPLIEQQHVHKVYDKIASHFSETRSKIWPSVKNFVESLPMGALMVDIGCGNGKNLRLRQDLMQIGIEYSGALATVAMYGETNNSKDETEKDGENQVKKTQEVAQGNCLWLPLRSNCADAAISIAVFHHLVTEERRMKAVEETVRILKPGGRALISVWAKDQARGENKTSYLKQSRKNRKSTDKNSNGNSLIGQNFITEEIKDSKGVSINVNLPVHVNRTQFLHQDLLVPWKLKGQNHKISEQDEEVPKELTFMRFYHVFEEGELQRVCENVPGVRVMESFYEQGNWCVIIKKV